MISIARNLTRNPSWFRMVVIGLFWSGPALAATVGPVHRPGESALQALEKSAVLWRNLGKPDAERHVLLKILSVQPDHPRALFLLGELAFRGEKPDEGHAALQKMQQYQYQGTLRLELQALDRLYAKDRRRLAELRLDMRGGDPKHVSVLAHQMFPDGRPPGDLANEFCRVLSDEPGAWQALHDLFVSRIQSDSDDTANRLSLLELLSQRDDTRLDAIAQYAAMASQHDVNQQKLSEGWRWALSQLGHDPDSQRLRQQFLTWYPDNRPVREEFNLADSLYREETTRARQQELAQAAERQRLADDPVLQQLAAAEKAINGNQPEIAQKYLDAAYLLDRDNADIIGMRGLIDLHQGRHGVALQAFEQAFAETREDPRRSARWRDLIPVARYWDAVTRAKAARANGHAAEAIQILTSAHDWQPGQTEADHVVADSLIDLGQWDAALNVNDRLLTGHPDDVHAWQGKLACLLQSSDVDALMLAWHDANERGVQVLPALDLPKVRARLSVDAEGHPDRTMRHLEQALRYAPGAAWLRFDLAKLYQRLEQPALAQDVMREGLIVAPQDPDMIMAAALLESSTGNDSGALIILNTLPEVAWSEGMRALAARSRFETDLAHALAARHQADPHADHDWRVSARARAAGDPQKLLRVAGADLAANDTDAAKLTLAMAAAEGHLSARQGLQLAGYLLDAGQVGPADRQFRQLADRQDLPVGAVWLLQARLDQALAKPDALKTDLQTLDRLLPVDDVHTRLEAMDLLRSDEADLWLDRLQEIAPRHPAVQLAGAERASRQGRDNDAMRLVSAIPETSLNAAQHDQWVALRRRIEQDAQPRIEVAQEWDSRNATSGTSSLTEQHIPMQFSWPADYESHWVAQIDLMHVDAGPLGADPASQAQWGALLANGFSVNPLTAPYQGVAPVHGMSLLAGWAGNRQYWDLGVVGLGTGGARPTGRWQHEWQDEVNARYTIEVSSRPQTGSFLALVGARDPLSGMRWGAATDTAVTGKWQADLAVSLHGSSQLLVGVVNGEHLPANIHEQWRGEVDRDWVNLTGFRANLGVLGNAWHYDRNLSFFTLGQGGYYSPQRYLSIGMPIELSGHGASWAYDVRATPSRAWTREDDTAYFPSDPALQQQSGNPIHHAGAGGGWAVSAHAAFEYRFASQWTGGAWIDLDRSTYYAPTRFMAYVRYALRSEDGRGVYWPRSILPVTAR